MDIYIVSCVFAITNNVAVSILVAISLYPCANISVGQNPKMELHFKFDRHCQIVLQNCVSIHTSIRCVRVPISLLYLQPWILCLLNFCSHKAESGVALFHFAFLSLAVKLRIFSYTYWSPVFFTINCPCSFLIFYTELLFKKFKLTCKFHTVWIFKLCLLHVLQIFSPKLSLAF